MKDLNKIKQAKGLRRQARTRAKITGTADKPRLSVFRSLLHIYGQAIDDIGCRTLVAVSDKQVKVKGNKTVVAQAVGEAIGKKLIEKKINKIVFDKGAYKYHGRVKAMAEGIRKAGIIF